jgi:hypothetical protein
MLRIIAMVAALLLALIVSTSVAPVAAGSAEPRPAAVG